MRDTLKVVYYKLYVEIGTRPEQVVIRSLKTQKQCKGSKCLLLSDTTMIRVLLLTYHRITLCDLPISFRKCERITILSVITYPLTCIVYTDSRNYLN